MTFYRHYFRDIALALVLASVAHAGLAAETHRVSQKGRKFQPVEIVIAKGDTLLITNDDGELLHHVFVQSSAFSFDSGQQEPGKSVEVTFPKTGTFEVLCGIHPRMRLNVTVQ